MNFEFKKTLREKKEQIANLLIQFERLEEYIKQHNRLENQLKVSDDDLTRKRKNLYANQIQGMETELQHVDIYTYYSPLPICSN